MIRRSWLLLVVAALLAACAPLAPAVVVLPPPSPTPAPTAELPTSTPDLDATALPAREPFDAGTPLPYITQTGDTVLALAAHFNTTAEEIVAANPGLPLDRTLTPGLTLAIPAYWFPLGGSPYQIIPDSELVYGPTSRDFDVEAFVAAQPGYLRTLSAFVAERQRTGAGVVLYVAEQYSINPRLLLALMEWRTGALAQADAPADVRQNPLGPAASGTGLFGQLRAAAEALTTGYYGWRTGQITALHLPDSTTSRPDMYQPAGTVAVQYLLAQWLNYDDFMAATGPAGIGATYIRLFGNPFDQPAAAREVLPGNLTQPVLELPFASSQVWAFTGGPHPVWGDATPWAALDFAPGGITGCANTDLWVTAEATGVVVRSENNTVVLDLDGDGYEQTGWVLFHFHMAESERVPVGTVVQVGDRLGHPSCEGGTATGTHVHMARKYNGEWIPADGVLPGMGPFVLGGWTAQKGDAPYLGRLMRVGTWVEACTCSTAVNTVYWVK